MKKRLIIVLILIAIVAVVLSLICCEESKIFTIISVTGSIASIYAIVEIIIQANSVKKQGKEIQDAVQSKIHSINKQHTSELVCKNVELITNIQSFINNRNADAAIIKIDELQTFLNSLIANPTTGEETKTKIDTFIKRLVSDKSVLRAKNEGENFPGDANVKLLQKHFDDLHLFLDAYSQEIHFDYDK